MMIDVFALIAFLCGLVAGGYIIMAVQDKRLHLLFFVIPFLIVALFAVSLDLQKEKYRADLSGEILAYINANYNCVAVRGNETGSNIRLPPLQAPTNSSIQNNFSGFLPIDKEG